MSSQQPQTNLHKLIVGTSNSLGHSASVGGLGGGGQTGNHPLLAAKAKLAALKAQFQQAIPDKEHFASLQWNLESAEKELMRQSKAEQGGVSLSDNLPPISRGAPINVISYTGWKKYDYGGKKPGDKKKNGTARAIGSSDDKRTDLNSVPLQGFNPHSFIAKKIR